MFISDPFLSDPFLSDPFLSDTTLLLNNPIQHIKP